MTKRRFISLSLVSLFSLLAAPGTGLLRAAWELPAANADAPQQHPQMEAALASLRNARDRLHAAATAYGGHRSNAERLAGEAIVEVRKALSYAQTKHAGNPQPPPMATGQRPAVKGYPEMHAALAALRTARNHLQNAAKNFAGHRVNALNLTDRAINECIAALKYVHSYP